ncbi:recombinase family protein [Streptomyces albireticuli]|uniref:recombinase family protein n=1 Tax=Streptomyces albireticuli TaxID=1940 RepID=UPI00369E5A45
MGHLRRPAGEIVLDPDEQVRAVVRLIFDLFDELATINAVLSFLAGNGIQMGVRMREGPEKGELVWRRPSRVGIQNMLRHPAYAGIYIYGRSRLDPRRRRAGHPFTGRVRQSREDWLVHLPGVLPAYISLERHERNLARIEANRARAQSMGALREGPALLAGLVFCGRCGTRMTVHYQRGRDGELWPAYECSRAKADYGGELCQQMAGTCVDRYVAGLLLAAVAPAALEVSLQAAEQAQHQREQWTGSGASGWNARTMTSAGPGASTSWPSLRTVWSSGNWRRPGSMHWPGGGNWARSTTASPRPGPVP